MELRNHNKSDKINITSVNNFAITKSIYKDKNNNKFKKQINA